MVARTKEPTSGDTRYDLRNLIDLSGRPNPRALASADLIAKSYYCGISQVNRPKGPGTCESYPIVRLLTHCGVRKLGSLPEIDFDARHTPKVAEASPPACLAKGLVVSFAVTRDLR